MSVWVKMSVRMRGWLTTIASLPKTMAISQYQPPGGEEKHPGGALPALGWVWWYLWNNKAARCTKILRLDPESRVTNITGWVTGDKHHWLSHGWQTPLAESRVTNTTGQAVLQESLVHVTLASLYTKTRMIFTCLSSIYIYIIYAWVYIYARCLIPPGTWPTSPRPYIANPRGTWLMP